MIDGYNDKNSILKHGDNNPNRNIQTDELLLQKYPSSVTHYQTLSCMHSHALVSVVI